MYKVVAPLGPRIRYGTFDTFFDFKKYKSLADAESVGDVVVANFVEDDDHVKYFELYNISNPGRKVYLCLQIQHFPLGIDVMDDAAALEMAKTLYSNS